MWLLQTRAMRDTICHQRFYLRSYESNCTDKSFVPYIICIWLLTWTISVGLSLQYSSFDSWLGLSALVLAFNTLHLTPDLDYRRWSYPSILFIWLLTWIIGVGLILRYSAFDSWLGLSVLVLAFNTLHLTPDLDYQRCLCIQYSVFDSWIWLSELVLWFWYATFDS